MAVNFEIVRLIGDKLQSSTIRVEHLTATGDESRRVRFHRSQGVRNADMGCFGVSLGQFPRDSTRLGVEGHTDPPHDIGLAVVSDRAVLPDQLDWQSEGSRRRLELVMEVEVLIGATYKSGMPVARKVNEENLKFVPKQL